MTFDTDSRAAEIFEAALDLNPGERTAFLARACAGDSFLQAKVESLLATDARTQDFLVPPEHSPALGRAPLASLDPLIGTQIGRYR